MESRTPEMRASPPPDRRRPQSPAEELANALTHGLGLVLALACLVILVVSAALFGDAWRVVTLSIFGATLVAVYLASTIYHLARSERFKQAMRVIDHAAIYLLIAGTYTPFMLVAIGGAWGWGVFVAIWALAAAGVVFQLFTTGRHQALSTLLYLGMGWLGLVAAAEIARAMSGAGLAWLVAGGAAYSVGVVFYGWRRLRFHHAIWHCFVLAGSACHTVAIWLDVVPMTP